MQEEYKKWIPTEGIKNEMWVEVIEDDSEGLKILLTDNDPSSITLRICFKQYLMYRNIDESYRSKLWSEANFEQGDWSFFQTRSSKLIDWLYEESGGVYEKSEMIHYVIKTGADVVDIISINSDPEVKMINEHDFEHRSISKKLHEPQIPDSVLRKRGKRGIYYDKI